MTLDLRLDYDFTSEKVREIEGNYSLEIIKNSFYLIKFALYSLDRSTFSFYNSPYDFLNIRIKI